MISIHQITKFLAFLLVSATTLAQTDNTLAKADKKQENPQTDEAKPVPQKVVVVTGARFSYKLIEKWIDDYSKLNPNVQVIIDSRGSNDPLKYDILAEVYEQDEELKKDREYIYVGRYPILPVATAESAFAKLYAEKGLNKDLINQIFFHDIFIDREKVKPIKEPFTTYTRMQRAGVPMVFAKYFGHEQKDIKGNAIAGSDAHLVKAVLRDSTAVTYLPLPLIYDFAANKPIDGLTVLPVDFNGNGKVSDEEKFYNEADKVIQKLESADPSDIKNIPISYLHLSVNRTTATQDAVDFLKWVYENGQADLHQFGFLTPDSKKGNERFNDFASKRGTN